MKDLLNPRYQSKMTIMSSSPRNHTFAVTGLIAALVALVVLSLFHSNPFGNIPDGVMDESPFVYGALSAIAHHTLLGLDFTPGGAYYGNLTAYISVTFIAMKLAYLRGLAIQVGETGFDFHFGDLTQLVRLGNAFFMLAAAACLAWLTFRDSEKDPEAMGFAPVLLWLLLADSLFVTIAPTGKVWVISVVLELCAAWLVARQERLIRVDKATRPPLYAAVLLWVCFLACLQNVAAGVMTLLWVAYALALRHLKIKDILKAAMYAFPAWLVLLGMDASFIKRFADAMFGAHGLTRAAQTSFTTASGSIDFFRQFTWPISTVFWSAPLALVAVLGCFFRDLFGRRIGWDRQRRWTAILYLHVVLTLIGYHFVFGLGQWVRYVLPLTVAFCVAACFLPKPSAVQRILLVMAMVTGIVVSGKAASLWMRPSSESEVTAFLQEEVRTNDAIVVHDQILKLPDDLNLPAAVFYDDGTSSPASTNGGRTWVVTSGCANVCQVGESACRSFVSVPCDKPLAYPQEGEVLKGLFDAERLGGRYFVRTDKSSTR